MDSDNDLMFADDDNDTLVDCIDEKNSDHQGAWKVILVDDEEAIHSVTQMALDGFIFDGKGLEFIHAYSGKTAIEAIHEHPDAAIMLLDVVMETDHAGLEVARYIREDAKNQNVRIILRTGQPGQSPEREVITKYDINDYKEKTELTSQKLFTLMYASLRSFRDIISLEANKRGLEQVIESSANIFELKSMRQFTEGVLGQLTSLLHLDGSAAYMKADSLAVSHQGDLLNVMAATGNYANLVGQDAARELAPDELKDIQNAIEQGGNLYREDRFAGAFRSSKGAENVLYLAGVKPMNEVDQSLMEMFAKNISIAYENIELHHDIEETQREIVYMLGEAVETRSKETGNHVKRVAEISKLLALEYGLQEGEAEVIRLASPLHDVGKIGIPDAILNKPGKHTPEEWEIMQTHAMLGYDMLKSSKKRILQAGAVIARDHHEKWAGGGYPFNKSGEDIHLYGRITAVADVFDALGSDRCYKKAWPLDKIIDLLNAENGKQFEPRMVEILLDNLDQVSAICSSYKDTE